MAPQLIEKAYFDLDDVTFPAQVTFVQFVPAKLVVERDIDGETFAAAVPAEGGMVKIKGLSDFEDDDSLSTLLLTHHGEKATMIYAPFAAGDKYFAVDVILPSVAIGGERNKFQPIDVDLVALTKPVVVSAPTP